MFDDFWKNLDSENYTKGLNEIPESLFSPMELLSQDKSFGVEHQVYNCPPGQFQLGKSRCFNRLDCHEIAQQVVPEEKILATGIGKQIRTAQWYYSFDSTVSLKVAYVETRPSRQASPRIAKRVKRGALNLLDLQDSKHAQTVIGYCFEPEKNNTLLISEFCGNGNLAGFVASDEYASWGACERLGLATSLVEAFDYLHNSPIGTRINCDMNRLHRALTQFLVTDDFRVVLNDVDDIPQSGSQCTWSRFVDEDSNLSSFLAPEQRSRLNADTTAAASHTEKIDIWKIPDMVMHVLLKSCSGEVRERITQILVSIRPVLNECKLETPENRPSAGQVLEVLRQTMASCSRNGW